MGDTNRPPLGFEYEVALAKVDTTQTLTFDESPYPTITGAFEVIGCHKGIRCRPPVDRFKAVPCGYNPASHIIPAIGSPGSLGFDVLDQAEEDAIREYMGCLCVARIVCRVENTDVRTMYCSYYVPSVEYRAPDGDDPGTATCEGEFTLIHFDP